MPQLLRGSGVRLKPHLPQTCLFLYLEPKLDHLFSLKLFFVWHAGTGRKLLHLLFGCQRLCLKSRGRPQPAGPATSPIQGARKRTLNALHILHYTLYIYTLLTLNATDSLNGLQARKKLIKHLQATDRYLQILYTENCSLVLIHTES